MSQRLVIGVQSSYDLVDDVHHIVGGTKTKEIGIGLPRETDDLVAVRIVPAFYRTQQRASGAEGQEGLVETLESDGIRTVHLEEWGPWFSYRIIEKALKVVRGETPRAQVIGELGSSRERGKGRFVYGKGYKLPAPHSRTGYLQTLNEGALDMSLLKEQELVQQLQGCTKARADIVTQRIKDLGLRVAVVDEPLIDPVTGGLEGYGKIQLCVPTEIPRDGAMHV